MTVGGHISTMVPAGTGKNTSLIITITITLENALYDPVKIRRMRTKSFGQYCTASSETERLFNLQLFSYSLARDCVVKVL